MNLQDLFPYKPDSKYSKPVAYFSMEFAIDQSLKIYSGGLGFLAGSHLRSAFELKQNLVGIGILWKYGYYDQERSLDGTMKVSYQVKDYSFLTDPGINFTITIHNHIVNVKAWLLKPDIFGTAPLFLLSTDVPENDHLAQTICHRLYDHHESARIAQSILLGKGGAKLLDILGRETEVYHMNEGHALPLCFYLLNKFKSLEEVKQRVVFTTHTPEKAGNEEHAIASLEVLGFFQGADKEIVLQLASPDEKKLSYTIAALRMAKKANGVSRLHGEVSRKMWSGFSGICPITAITNAQNKKFWADDRLELALHSHDDRGLVERKKEMKRALFKEVADQTGKQFRENIITIVWARRLAGYKRANLLLHDLENFESLVSSTEFPVQIIWAGKPYPEDQSAIQMFNDLHLKMKSFSNCTVLTGYEMALSALLKKGSDIWLNTPRIYHEASGTSGMTAAMNGSINVSVADGWVPEFAKDGENSFVIPSSDSADQQEQDRLDASNLISVLRSAVKMYYQQPQEWLKIVKRSMYDVTPYFDSDRMVREYYEKMYTAEGKESQEPGNEFVSDDLRLKMNALY